MAAHGESHYAAQQEERITEIRKHINRLRKFLLDSGNSSSGATGAMPGNLTGPRH